MFFFKFREQNFFPLANMIVEYRFNYRHDQKIFLKQKYFLILKQENKTNQPRIWENVITQSQ